MIMSSSRSARNGELIAHMYAVIRRTRTEPEDGLLRHADLEMDLVAYRAYRAGKAIHLGPTEFRAVAPFPAEPAPCLLARTAARPGLGAGRGTRTAHRGDVHIRRLRRALNAHGGSDLLRTVRSVGYAGSTVHGGVTKARPPATPVQASTARRRSSARTRSASASGSASRVSRRISGFSGRLVGRNRCR